MTSQFPALAAATTAVFVAMIRLGLWKRALVPRRPRRCASCGRRLTTRTCPRCAA